MMMPAMAATGAFVFNRCCQCRLHTLPDVWQRGQDEGRLRRMHRAVKPLSQAAYRPLWQRWGERWGVAVGLRAPPRGSSPLEVWALRAGPVVEEWLHDVSILLFLVLRLSGFHFRR